MSLEQAVVPVVAKDYPRPTLKHLNQLGDVGELVYTMLDEPGYPEIVAVDTGADVLPWWIALSSGTATTIAVKTSSYF